MCDTPRRVRKKVDFMVGILLIAHAPLADALARSAAHVYACAPDKATRQLRVFDVPPDVDVPAAVVRARGLVGEIDDGSGVLVLTDIFGATPGNVAAQLADPGRVAVVAGVNLPMLLRTLCYRDVPLVEVVEKALAGGVQAVMQVSSTPPQNQGRGPQTGPSHDLARLHHQQ
jgi:PTS system ascorbate-specific IIA component